MFSRFISSIAVCSLYILQHPIVLHLLPSPPPPCPLSVTSSPHHNQDLKNPAFILFLNKLDLFADKIAFQHAKLQPWFPDYLPENEGDVEEAKEFLANQFRMRNQRGAVALGRRSCCCDDLHHTLIQLLISSECLSPVTRKDLYVHYTTAIETDHMQKIFESTQEIILNNSLVASGIVM